MVKKGQKKSILSSALITVFIVIMLIISGPAQAVSVIISGLGGTYTKGSSIGFTVSVAITDPDKYVPVTNISLDVTGPVNLNRAFALNGTPLLGGNPAITITPVHTPQPDQFGYGYGYGIDSVGYGYGYFGYGYGYGYGYGAGRGTVTYTYDVIINSASLPAGSYTAIAKLNTGKAALPSFNSASKTFEIASAPEPEIISWGNNKTGDGSLNITVNQSETVRFNATADQIITEWEWNVNDDDQDNNFDNLSYRFDTVGSYEVKVEAENDNGTSDEIIWTVDVKDNTPSGDTIPPGSISGLHNISYAPDYINWTWTDPTDTDFSRVIVSIDGGPASDVLKGIRFYNATGFAPDTEHTISTRTVDTSGNINGTWVNRTDRTAPVPPATPIQVTIEIKPETINPKSNGKITVTIFNNDSAGFDVGSVNISTVRFGPNGTAPFWNNSPAGKKLMLKFYTNDTGIQCGDTQANLTGKTYSGQDISGSGSFRTKECSIVVSLSTDGSGITTTPVTKESPSGDMTITIPAGTRALDKDGNPLLNITISSLTDLSPKARKKLSPKDRPAGEFVKLEPSGSTFTPPIQIRYNYTEPLPDGVSESSLQIRTYNETTDNWETLPVIERNTENNYIIVNVSHFSTFALIGMMLEASSGPAGSSGSSGSTGGGGVITLEPFENIEKAETREENLVANIPVIYTFTAPNLGVYELAVTGKESENDVAIRVEALKGTSKLVTSPAPGTVYKNVNIWAGTKRLKEAMIRFKVENSWLDSNNLATGDAKIVKWDGNKWIPLDTTEIRKDASYTYFEAKTDTFSIFAITGLSGALPTTTPTVTPQQEVTSTGTAAATQTSTSEAPSVNLSIIIAVIVLIAIVAAVYFKRKEIFKKP